VQIHYSVNFLSDSGTFLNDRGDFLSDSGNFLNDRGGFLSDSGNFLNDRGDFLSYSGTFLNNQGGFLSYSGTFLNLYNRLILNKNWKTEANRSYNLDPDLKIGFCGRICK